MTLVHKQEAMLEIRDLIIYSIILVVVLTLMGLYTYLNKLIRRLFNIDEPEIVKQKE